MLSLLRSAHPQVRAVLDWELSTLGHPRLQQTAQTGQTAATAREAAFLVADGAGDCAPGTRAAAGEFDLAFLPLGSEPAGPAGGLRGSCVGASDVKKGPR